MHISSLFGESTPTVSFEFYPPKTDVAQVALLEAIDHLAQISPDFVSMTYGAGGSARGLSLEASVKVKLHTTGEVMTHLTGISHTCAEIAEIADYLWEAGITNIMALRGDRPIDAPTVGPFGDFKFGKELVAFLKTRHDFCVGSGCYPEGHLETPDLSLGIEHLKQKVDIGCDFLVTQMFLDNGSYFRFLDLTAKAGIDVPIIPGIMPVTGFAQLGKFETKFGVKLPSKLRSRVEVHEGDKTAIERAGVEWAAEQCKDLLDGGAPGIHFYTLNRSHATVEICESLNLTGKSKSSRVAYCDSIGDDQVESKSELSVD